MAKKEKTKEPQYYLSAINNPVLNYNVYVMKAWEKLIYSLGLLIIGGALGLIFYGGLFSKDGKPTFATFVSNIVVFLIVGLLAIKFFLPSLNNMLKNRRIKKLKAQFRDFLNSISNSLSGGMNVMDAIFNSYDDLSTQYAPDAYMVLEVKEIIDGVNNNVPIEEMLRDFGTRSNVDDIANFAVVFDTAYRTGGNLKEIVRRTTDIISEKMIIAEEIQTKLTSNKLQMQVMNVIPVVVMLIMKNSSSDFAAAFSSLIGVVCITIAVAMFIAAFKLGQKITDIKG